MATWPGNCGYCNAPGSGSLQKDVCPKCARTGCPTCMPTGSSIQCNQCTEVEDREKFEYPPSRKQ